MKSLGTTSGDWDFDSEDFKSVWFPGGEELKFRETREVLKTAGYVVRDSGIGEIRSAWFFHLIRSKHLGRLRFRHHLRDLLWPLGLQIHDHAVNVERFGQNLIILIFWPVPACGEARRDVWEEISSGAMNRLEFAEVDPRTLPLKAPATHATNGIVLPTAAENDKPW